MSMRASSIVPDTTAGRRLSSVAVPQGIRLAIGSSKRLMRAAGENGGRKNDGNENKLHTDDFLSRFA
jgi:hypothetical protein